MSLLKPRQPLNTNYLQTTKYQVSLSFAGDAVYFCQDVNLPGVELGSAVQATPGIDLFNPGTKLSYNPFRMTFIVNENISSWKTIYDWMNQMSNNQDGTTKRYREKQMGTLTILSNLNNPKIRIKFSDIYPTSLGDIQFSTTGSAEEIITATAEFRYNYFEIENL